MSDGYEGREIAASYNTNAGGTVVEATTNFIDFNNKIYDSTNSVVGAGNGNSTNWQNTWRYVVPVSGSYYVSATTTISLPANIMADVFSQIAVNGNFLIRGTRSIYTTSGWGELRAVVVSGVVNVKAGDAISIAFFQSSGANRSLEPVYDSNTVSIHRISSPQTIAMGEVVAGYATNSSGQSIPNASFTAVTNWTVVNDTHGIFDPTTGVLTVNKSGFIEIASSLVFNPNASGGRSSAIERNGSNLTINDYPTASGVTVSVPISLASYPVKAGDTFKIKAFQNSGGNLSLASSALYNYISWRIY
jgi:hypothetical protein